MTSEAPRGPVTRRAALQRAGAAALPLLAAPMLLRPRPALAAAERPSATLTLHRVDIALLLNAGWGGGMLYYQGRHPFKIKGLGVGGIGVSKLEAYGNVFRLKQLSDFGGLYGSVQAGAVAGDAQLHGGLWMENPAGVQIHLVPRRQGVSLNLGASGVLITFDT
jgi:hypothetical protein